MSQSSFNLQFPAIEDFIRQGGEVRLQGEGREGYRPEFLLEVAMDGQQVSSVIDWAAVREFRCNIVESVFKTLVQRLDDRKIGAQLSGPGYSAAVSTVTVPGVVSDLLAKTPELVTDEQLKQACTCHRSGYPAMTYVNKNKVEAQAMEWYRCWKSAGALTVSPLDLGLTYADVEKPPGR